MMARAPGVGPKLAARLVLELKDKAPASAADLGGAIADGEPALETRRRPRRTRCSRWSASATPDRRLRSPSPGASRALGAEAQTAALIRAGLEGAGAVREFYDIVIDLRRVKS